MNAVNGARAKPWDRMTSLGLCPVDVSDLRRLAAGGKSRLLAVG